MKSELPAFRVSWWKPLLALALTAGGLALALRRVDFAQLQTLLQQTRWAWLAAGIGAFGCACLASAARWHLALRVSGQALRPVVTLRIFLVGHFCTLALLGPAGGDIARSALYSRWFRLPLPEVIASAPLERALGVVGGTLFAFVAVGIAAVRGKLPTPKDLPFRPPGAGALTIGAVALLLLIGLFLSASRRREKGSRLHRFLCTLLDGGRELIVRPRLAMQGILLGVATQFAIAFVTATCLEAVGTRGLVWPDVFWTFSVVSLVTVLPSVGGLGVRESAVLVLLGLYGIAPEFAVSAALLCFAVQLLWAIVGASLLWREERAFQIRQLPTA